MTLTKREHELWCFITAYRKQAGLGPIYDEMMEALSVSRSRIANLLNSLERKGYIKHIRYRNSRSIVPVVKSCPHCGGEL